MSRIPSLLVCLVLAACGGDRSTGGGGFGGETVSGRVVDADGRPVVGALVRARISMSLDAGSLRETSTDDSGRFVLADLPPSPLRIEIAGRSGTDSVMAIADRDPGKALGEIAAPGVSDRRIRIVDGQGHPVAAALQAYGLGSVTSTDDSGVLGPTRWPAADIWARVSPRGGGAPFDLLIPARPKGDLVASSGWLLDDFEGVGTRTRLGLLIGGGWWYSASAGTLPPTSSTDIAPFYDGTQAHGGQVSLHAAFAFDPSNSARYGLVGFHLGAIDGQPVDLSGMDSLVLWAKGNGPVRVELVAMDGDVQRIYAKEAVPGSDWTRIAMVPSDFVSESGGSPWAVASARAVRVQFSVFQDTEFWLDDLRLYARRLP